jgi:polysaccharide deacetylase family protein (PEP-CTERM system associated)
MKLATRPAYILSIDVEDWFHILDCHGAPPLHAWSSLPSRVERNFFRILDLLSDNNVTSTMFFLGWIAERLPHLVREAKARGHEIASHSYAHRLIYTMTPEEFTADTRRARMILQDISGKPVLGYRAPGFSVTADTPWFFERLAAAGHTYDASVFPARRGHGGWSTAEPAPHIALGAGQTGKPLIELPVSVATVLGRRVCFFGGGYMRLFPLRIIRMMAKRVHATGRPVIFYLHPRDIDPEQPRLPMPLLRSFKCYVNAGSACEKLENLSKTFSFISFREYLTSAPSVELPQRETAALLKPARA